MDCLKGVGNNDVAYKMEIEIVVRGINSFTLLYLRETYILYRIMT